jgi:hypothetical protein
MTRGLNDSPTFIQALAGLVLTAISEAEAENQNQDRERETAVHSMVAD